MFKTHPENWWIQLAHLSRQRDKGTYLHVVTRPLWVVVLGEIGDRLFFDYPEWTYRICWGPVDEEGWTKRSLGHVLFCLSQWNAGGFGTWKLEHTVAEIRLDRDQVLEYFPDVDPIFTDDSEDSMRGKPEKESPDSSTG